MEDDIYARPMSAYEYASYLRLDRDLTYFLSHPDNFCLIDFGIPKSTSKLFLGIILNKLDAVNAENFEVSMPRQIAAPAATAMIPTFVNCAIGSRIPDNRVWATALTEDPVRNMLLDMVASPATAHSQEVVNKLPYIYRQPARQGHFVIRDKILFMREIFQNDDRYIELKIVPESLQNIVFVCRLFKPYWRPS